MEVSNSKASLLRTSSRNGMKDHELITYIKSGHTVSFDGHMRNNIPMLPSRSAALLPSRGPAYPCMSLDLSVDVAEENLFRRSAHQEILTRNPSAFRRYKAFYTFLNFSNKYIFNSVENGFPKVPVWKCCNKRS
jgi:hypothetical protein